MLMLLIPAQRKNKRNIIFIFFLRHKNNNIKDADAFYCTTQNLCFPVNSSNFILLKSNNDKEKKFFILKKHLIRGKKNKNGTQKIYGEKMRQALLSILEGNKRFYTGKPLCPNQNEARRKELLSSQNPNIAILSCADSRIPPEIIFDQGIGDIFVIRNAGNILDSLTLGSLEYAARHLKVSLIIVLGHEDCGAVKSSLSGGKELCSIDFITNKIKPAVKKAKTLNGDILENAIKINVINVINELKECSDVIKERVNDKSLELSGLYYSMSTGKVEVLKEIL